MSKFTLALPDKTVETVEADGWTIGAAGELMFWKRRLAVNPSYPVMRWAFRTIADGHWKEVGGEGLPEVEDVPIDPPAPPIDPQPEDLTGEPQAVTQGGGCVDLQPPV